MVSGTNTENDLSDRVRAEQGARLALGRFRREVHNACDKSLSGVSGPKPWKRVRISVREKPARWAKRTTSTTRTASGP